MSETRTPDDAQLQAKPIQQPIIYNQASNQPPSQPYIMYVPQANQPSLNCAKPQYVQVQPVQYPQMYGQQNPQQPLLQNQYYYYQQQPRQIVPPPQKIVYKHDELSKAGQKEKRLFNMLTLLFCIIIQSVSVIFCSMSVFNSLVRISYEPDGEYFLTGFYVVVVLLGLTWLFTYTNSMKLRKKPFNILHFLVFTLLLAFFVQAIYSSSYSCHYYDQYTPCSLRESQFGPAVLLFFSYLNTTSIGLFSYVFQELQEIKFKYYIGYILFPTSCLTIVFCFYSIIDIFYVFILQSVAVILALLFMRILQRANEKGLMKLRSDQYLHASLLFHFLMIVPFFEDQYAEEQPTTQQQPQQQDQQRQ